VTSLPANQPERHAFVRRPHRTFVVLFVPVLASLLAEPLTGLVDTVFVARLGSAPLAALGIAATLLSSLFWVFNFLAIGTQTEVARALGAGSAQRARDTASLALALGALVGAGVALAAWPWLEALAAAMSPDAPVQAATAGYLAVRLLGAPAVLLTLAGFGALRGLQDMRSPLWIAGGANAVNVALDPLLIFGAGPVPALGVVGAAWASTAGQWLGALWVVSAVRRRLGLSARIPWGDTPALLRVGRDLFARTALLTLFLLLATRAATRLGAEAGAAHQAVRQVWLLSAFLLDAYAATAQSLVAWFLGAQRPDLARRVAAVSCTWGLGTGVLLAAAMGLAETAAAALLVPPAAQALFPGAWHALAWSQPLNALSFVTDGIHWGTRDYRYLRNAMLASSATGLALLAALTGPGTTLERVWWITAAWIAVRCAFGVLRIWPGPGASPLSSRRR
jgi:MATE family multidrug resistance protein